MSARTCISGLILFLAPNSAASMTAMCSTLSLTKAESIWTSCQTQSNAQLSKSKSLSSVRRRSRSSRHSTRRKVLKCPNLSSFSRRRAVNLRRPRSVVRRRLWLLRRSTMRQTRTKMWRIKMLRSQNRLNQQPLRKLTQLEPTTLSINSRSCTAS